MRKFIFSVLFSLLLANVARADLILDLTGDAGSSIVSFSTSGSATVNGSSIAGTGTEFRLPVALNPSFRFWAGIADFDGLFSTSGSDSGAIALSAPINVAVNGSSVASFVRVDLRPDFDLVVFESTSSNSYPAVSPGDVLSWSGSGTFNLNGGSNNALGNFETVFNSGSHEYSDASRPVAADGSVFINVNSTSSAAVPEPSSMALLSFGAVGVGLCRSRRRKRTDEAPNA